VTTDRNVLIFGKEHPWGEQIPVCSNEVPGVMYGLTPVAQTFIVVSKGVFKKCFSRTAAPDGRVFE